MITITVSGSEQIVASLQKLAPAALNEVATSAYMWGETVMNESKRECPVDKGFLRASGNVDDPIVTSEGFAITLEYPMEYAVYVHENLEANHPTGKAKFLEDPMMAHLGELPDTIGRAVMSAAGGSK
jgi:hypothetical protein